MFWCFGKLSKQQLNIIFVGNFKYTSKNTFLMIIKRLLKSRFLLLSNPKEGYNEYEKSTLEEVVSEYLKLLIFVSIMSGLSSFVIMIGRSAYFHLFLNADVSYINAFNYAFGQASGSLLFCFFMGTFIVFLISVILNPFFKIKYVVILKTLLISLTPLLLFGWILILLPGIVIWAVFLLFTGLNMQRNKSNPGKNSIEQRD